LYLRLTILSLFFSANLFSQTLGGNSVFNFIKLPNTPQLSALGGINISHISNDIGMVFNNPALLRSSMHTQMNVVFNSFYAESKVYHLSMAYHNEKWKTNFAWGLNYFGYGNTVQTDPSGNELGNFRPTDWVMQVSASKSYLQKWNYGVTVKFISSNYGLYRSNGIAADVGVLYHDTAALFSASVVAKNMGTQLRKYNGASPEDMPFDLQIGISKKLANAPLGFSATAQRLHQFDIDYNDTVFNNDNGFENSPAKKFSVEKLLNHFILASTIYLADKVEFQVGYNFLRRRELNIGNTSNGLNGFSLGAGVLLGKLQIRYARAYYQSNTAYNQFGLNMKLNEYFGLGKFGKRIGW
jgi:hypothetical protein